MATNNPLTLLKKRLKGRARISIFIIVIIKILERVALEETLKFEGHNGRLGSSR